MSDHLQCFDGRTRDVGRAVLWFKVMLLVWLVTENPAVAANLAREVPVGGRLPDATLHGLNGPSRALSAYLGKPLIINVWASWCGPCRSEMASLERLAWRKESGSFSIIGVSTDDDAGQATDLLIKTNATISQFIDRELRMEDMLGASRLPLTVLVDARGMVIAKIYGARQWDGADALRLIDKSFQQSRKAAVMP